MLAPIAIHRPNRTHVSSGRLSIKYKQNRHQTMGRNRTHGVRNDRGRSGARRRNTIMPSATRMNANSVPVLVSSRIQLMRAEPAYTATKVPLTVVVMYGVV